jgi:hypothetical protein
VLLGQTVGHSAALNPAERRGRTRSDSDWLSVRICVPARAMVVVVMMDMERLRLGGGRRRSRGPEGSVDAGKGPDRGRKRSFRGAVGAVAQQAGTRLCGRLVVVAGVARVCSRGRRGTGRRVVDVDDGLCEGETGGCPRRARRRRSDRGVVGRGPSEVLAAIGSHGRGDDSGETRCRDREGGKRMKAR